MVRSETLKNGIRFITERIPTSDTVSIGFWINLGSSSETRQQNGYTHFIEHMLFKGADGMSASEIARSIDRVGGVMNAFTTREKTCFYVNVVSDHSAMAVDLLRKMYYQADFDTDELERERQVILQELKMYEDTPDEYIHDKFISSIWPEHSIGRPIAGTEDVVSSLKRSDVLKFYKNNYTSDRLVITVAGKLDHHLLHTAMKTYPMTSSNSSAAKIKPFHKPQFTINTYAKDLEQVHLILGFPAVSARDPRRYALYLLNLILGGGMSSRLYQRVREQEGSCYSIYSFTSLYKQQGVFAVYCATSPDFFEGVLATLREELLLMRDKGITDEELGFAKEQLKGNILLGRESVESRMNRLAIQELNSGKQEPIRAMLEKINCVTAEEIREVIGITLGDGQFSLTSIGNPSHQSIAQAFYGNGVLNG